MDIRPQIIVQERLHYETYIGLRTSVELKKAEGTIEVVIPAQTNNRTKTEKPIGYLALSNYGATVWEPQLREDGLPGKIPIQAPMANGNGRSIVRFNYAINPEAAIIPARPVFLEAKILEGSSIISSLQETGVSFYDKLRLQLTISSELSEQDGELAGGHEEQTKEIKGPAVPSREQSDAQSEKNIEAEEDAGGTNQATEALKEEATEKPQRDQAVPSQRRDNQIERQGCLKRIQGIFEKWQEYGLPSPVKINRSSRQREIKLAYVEIKAPYIRHLVRTEIGPKNDSEPLWHYNPERNSLELRDQVLERNPNTGLFEAGLCLDIDPPVNQIPELEGSFVLCVDEPVSKLQVEWSSKKRPDVDHIVPVYRTWLTLEFEIDFGQVFESRSFTAGRRLHFEGVVFQAGHIANIRHILSNHRLTILPDDFQGDQDQDEGKNDISERILALRQGAYGDSVWVQVTGQRRKGRRTIIYNDGHETLAKTIDLGALDINLFATMTGESEETNELLNAIQMDLERYFMSNTEGR